MNHFDEKILELYLLENSMVKSQREEIENHLAECSACSDLFDEIKEYYQSISYSNRSFVEPAKQIAAEGLTVRPSIQKGKSTVKIIPSSIPGKSLFYIIHHQVKSGLSLVAVIILALVGMNYNSVFLNTNPSYIITNDSTKSVSVYNSSHDKLWDLNWRTHREINKYENEFNIKFAGLSDINSNGSKELISVIPMFAGIEEKNIVSIFNKDKVLEKKVSIGSDIWYGGKFYPADFSTRGLTIGDYDNDGYDEIISGAYHINSPYLISRINHSGKVIGEYWHYGHFWGIHETDLNNDGKKEILLCGQNDKLGKSALAVLDPTQLIGKLESTYSSGFGLGKSQAELIYITFDKSELEELTGSSKQRFSRLMSETDEELSVFYSFFVDEIEHGFVFVFNKQFQISRIYPIDSAIRLFEKAKREKNTNFKLDEEYLEGLKNNLTYRVLK